MRWIEWGVGVLGGRGGGEGGREGAPRSQKVHVRMSRTRSS